MIYSPVEVLTHLEHDDAAVMAVFTILQSWGARLEFPKHKQSESEQMLTKMASVDTTPSENEGFWAMPCIEYREETEVELFVSDSADEDEMHPKQRGADLPLYLSTDKRRLRFRDVTFD